MVKAVIAPQLQDEFVIPHAVARETAAVWKARVSREKARPSAFDKTSIFEYKDIPYVVGEEALRSGSLQRRTGPQKYVEGYLDVLVVASLLKALPEGHNNLIVACAHATNSIPYVEQMATILGKVHKVVKPSGDTVKYAVRGFIPWDEPAGGLIRFANLNNANIHPGQRIAVVDIGGRISSMYVAEVQGNGEIQIFWSSGMAMELGIQDITETLQEELQSQYPEDFRVRTIPESILRDCLRNHGNVMVRGEPFDASQAYMNSTAQFLDRVRTTWENNMNAGIDVDVVVITGGGGGLTYSALVEELKHRYIYLADDITSINLANLRGGESAAAAWYNKNYRTLPTTKDNVRPLVFVIDPGNSDLKFKLLGAR